MEDTMEQKVHKTRDLEIHHLIKFSLYAKFFGNPSTPFPGRFFLSCIRQSIWAVDPQLLDLIRMESV